MEKIISPGCFTKIFTSLNFICKLPENVMNAKSHDTRNNKLCPMLSNNTPKIKLNSVKIAMYFWRNTFNFS
ncbi:hypothetical protein, partial [Lysinibacillus sp. D4A3_S15]|uniref:hypothetical protein n=1 Tax=Lysinibacillus sp. D4A3_S15 TaxID=2941227 RepID=UPI0020BD62DE